MGNPKSNRFDLNEVHVAPPEQKVNHMANAVGEITDVMFKTGLRAQAERLQQKIRSENRAYNEEQASQNRAMDMADRDEERSYRLGEEERKRGIMTDPTTPEGELHKLKVDKAQAEIDKASRYQETVKMPKVVEKKLDSMYKQLEVLTPGDPEYIAMEKQINQLSAKYDPAAIAAKKRIEELKAKQGDVSVDSPVVPAGIEKPEGVMSDPAQKIVDAEPMVNRAGEPITTMEEAMAAIAEHEAFTKRGMDKARHEREIMKIRNKFDI